MQRSGFEIRAEILYQIKNGVVLPTRIMYAVNCRWDQIHFYLDELVELGAVEYSAPAIGSATKRKIYRITAKGEDVLA